MGEPSMSTPSMPSDSTEAEESKPLLEPVQSSSSYCGAARCVGIAFVGVLLLPLLFVLLVLLLFLTPLFRLLSLLQNYQVADIKEHCCIVTGASQGLGKQFAKTLADEGVTRLVLAARNKEKLEQVKSEVTSAHPLCSVLVVPTDVTDAAARENLVQQSVLHAGSNKMTLINNAGYSAKQHIDHVPTPSSANKFDMHIDINLRGVLHLTHAFMPHLVKNGGHVVNVGSVASKAAAPFQAAYNATKFGVTGITKSVRMECKYMGWPVSVSAIYPGTVVGDGMAEDMRKTSSEEEWNYLIKTFGSTTPLAQAQAVIRAVNYDEPELYVVEPSPENGIILGDIFPRINDWSAREKKMLGPVWKWLSHMADVEGD